VIEMEKQRDLITPEWMRMSQFCRHTNIPRQTAYQLVREGRLEAVMIGSRWYVRSSEVQNLFARAANAA
jgi:excisionase family DNA binding protein